MSTHWRTVRVFLSSTFRDMHAERDHLVKVTFPALRQRLLPHRVELYDSDLRWGITEEESRNDRVISLCLQQIECRPFFLAFLGQRYGWVPGRVPDETRRDFPFVEGFPGVSVTELEIRHGALLQPDGRHCLTMLRQEEAVASIPPATGQRDFVDSEPRLQEQLARLKQELQAGPHPVRSYAAVWDGRRWDRVNRTEGKLVGLQATEIEAHSPDNLGDVRDYLLLRLREPILAERLDGRLAPWHRSFSEGTEAGQADRWSNPWLCSS
jgi:hypothetical protein